MNQEMTEKSGPDVSQFDREALEVKAELQKKASALEAEVALHNAAVGAGYADIERKEAVRLKVLEVLGGVASMGVKAATGGGVDPSAIIGSVVTLGALGYGVGTRADRKRKDKMITELKAA